MRVWMARMAGHGGAVPVASLGSSSTARDGVSAPQCFQLTYRSLEGYANLLNRKVEKHVSVAEYQLRSCMFSASLKRFRSRFHDSRGCGLVESLQRGAVVCPIEQSVFFYSAKTDPSLLLIVELTASYLSGSEEQCVVLGWAMLPVFHSRHQRHVHHHLGKTSSSVGGSSGAVRLSLYEGSPRALFSMTHPSPDSKELVPVPGCILSCSLSPHPTLGRAAHLFPSDTIVSYDDIIPGLAPARIPEAFPKLVRSTSATLEKVSLLLLPSVDDFEEQLHSQLLEDFPTHAGMDDPQTTITIEERRMKISVYNGWRFIGPPAIGYLEKVSPFSSSLSSSRGGSTHGPRRNNLILKGSLELSDIIPHPLMEIVLQLEYVVTWSGVATSQAPTAAPRNRANVNAKTPTNHTTTLTLSWGVWQPFQTDASLDTGCQVSVDLKAGPGFRPTVAPSSAHTACYEGKLGDAGKAAFKIAASKSSNRADSSQFITSSISNVQVEDFTPRDTGRDMPDTGRTEGHPVEVPHPPEAAKPPEQTSPRKEDVVPPPQPLPPPLDVTISSSHHSIPPTQSRSNTFTVSRSILAYLHSAGFEEFLDAKGIPFPSVAPSPATALRQDSQLKPLTSDPLQDGPYQIAIQLMAVAGGGRRLKSVTLSFRFFTFPLVTTTCSLVTGGGGGGGGGGEEGKGRRLPLLLQPPGDEVQVGVVFHYPITHLTLPGSTDRSDFTAYLTSGCLCVDVYDRDSQILLGTATVPLKGMLPHDHAHYQMTLSLPVELSQHTLDTSVSTITLGSGVGHGASAVGTRLYMRLARLPVHNRDLEQSTSPSKRSKPVVVARRLYGHGARGEEDGHRRHDEDEETTKRKHARMQCVRKVKQNGEGQEEHHELLALGMPSRPPLPPSQLNIIDVQREELKRKTIASVLEDSLTSSYRIKPRMGQAVYFEHEFRNQHTHPLSVSVSWKDPALRLVTDRRECYYLRQLYSIHTAIDDNLITESPEGGGEYRFFVHPSEAVRLPFRYQSFRELIQPSMHAGGEGGIEKTVIKVYFQSSQNDLLAILNVHVEPQQQRVDRVIHFYHPERTFLKKTLILPRSLLHYDTEDILAGSRDVFACSSEPDTTCEIRTTGESSTVFIKAAIKEAPLVHRFHIMLFRFLVSPTEVWQVVAHPVHRVDHSFVVGQLSGVKLTLHGNHTNRRITCHSLNAPNVQVVTPSPFLLSAHSLSELQVSMKTNALGNSHTVITATDMDNSRHLVDAWLLCCVSREPAISRAFQVALPTGGGTHTQKTITFTNPYAKQKVFSLSTNHPDIVTFGNSTTQLQPQETVVLGLLFAPSQRQLSVDVLVFINDELDRTEECFLVKTVYT